MTHTNDDRYEKTKLGVQEVLRVRWAIEIFGKKIVFDRQLEFGTILVYSPGEFAF